MLRQTLILLLIIFNYLDAFGQYPSYFNYTIENGCPSNEIYSILQDKQGYIWIGCDAGLYQFNGVKFKHFTSKELSSRSVSGLCQTSDGTIFAYNFNSQILFVKGDKLSVLKKWNKELNHLASDNNGKVFISSSFGLFSISNKTNDVQQLKNIFRNDKKNKNFFTNSIRVHTNGTISYIIDGNVIFKKGNQLKIQNLNKNEIPTPFYISDSPTNPWVFKMINGVYFIPKGNKYVRGENKSLINFLKTRKITNAQEVNGEIWISTYTGIIRCNKKTGKTKLYFPNMAFSSCIKDNEGNYWFTSLHNGILRLPNLDFISWTKQSVVNHTEMYSHVLTTKHNIYFASIDGLIGQLKTSNFSYSLTENNLNADIGALYFDEKKQSILYNKLNSVFSFSNGKSKLINVKTRPIKDFIKINETYLVASSQGLYRYSTIEKGFKEIENIHTDWSRQFLLSPFDSSVFLAANHGLYELKVSDEHVRVKRHLFKDRQISSISKNDQYLFVLTFDGFVYTLDKTGKIRLLFQFDEKYSPVQVKYFKNQLFFATNYGLFSYHLGTKKSNVLTVFDGLSSNNINAISFKDNYCWLATGKGLQRISLSKITKPFSKSKIIFRKAKVNDRIVSLEKLKQLHSNDKLKICIDGLSFYSNGEFYFAYRYKNDLSNWYKVPAKVNEISIPILPVGENVLEIKLIDFENNYSNKSILIPIYVKPPFWQRWWFYLILIIGVASVSFFVFRKRINILRKRQELKLHQLRLENELRLTQQNALKSQMNPHFLFNVLNSIKGFIYENDKKNAARYLSDFSNLVRKILEMSSLSTVSLAEEIETLNLYINLESMLLENDFHYELKVNPTVETNSIQIPALLLQPYIENSFKHGLRHKKGDKKITVSFEKEGEYLVIKIEDNGIGRMAANEINQHSNHKSFAMNANQKRIELLNFEKEGVIGVEFTDLVDDKNAAIGTRITLKFHLIYKNESYTN